MSIKFRSKYNHGFTNRGCVHCAILKALYGFKEKETTRQKIRNFSFKFFLLSNRDKNTTLMIYEITIDGHYYGVIIEGL